MSPKSIKYKPLWLSLFIATIIIYVFNPIEIFQSLAKISVWACIFVIALEWIFLSTESHRLFILADKSYTFSSIIKSRSSTILLSNFIGGSGISEVIRVLWLDKQNPGHKSYLVALLLINRVYALFTLMIILFLGLANNKTYHSDFMPIYPIIMITICLTPFGLISYRSLRYYIWLIIKFIHPNLGKTFLKITKALLQFSEWRAIVFATISSFITNLIAITIFWIVSEAMFLNIPFGKWMIYAPCIALFSIIPGMGAIGTQEAVLLLIANHEDITPEKIIAFSLIIHITKNVASLPSLLWIKETNQIIPKNMNRFFSKSSKPSC